jgi:hypothetical protein
MSRGELGVNLLTLGQWKIDEESCWLELSKVSHSYSDGISIASRYKL